MFKIVTCFALVVLLAQTGTCAQLDTELRDAMNILETRVQSKLSNNQNENTVIVVGPTGGGKSALITLLAGGNLDAIRSTDGSNRIVLDGHLNPNNPEIVIGHDNRPGTVVPGSHYLEPPRKTTIWDCPGFGDVRGPVADIINAASIFRVLGSVENMKVVIVLSHSKALERGAHIPDLFNGVAGLFEREDQLNEMVSMVITKSEPSVSHILRGYPGLSNRGSSLLDHLLSDGEKRISYLPKALNIGPYAFDLGHFWSVIDKTNFVNKPRIRATHSAGSRDYLGNLSFHLNQSIFQELKENRRILIDTLRDALIRQNLGTIRQISQEKIGSLESIGGVPKTREECIRVFTSTDMLPVGVRGSLISKIEQIHTIKNICDDPTVVDFDADRWFGAVSETVEMLRCISDLTFRTLELDSEREKIAVLQKQIHDLDMTIAEERARFGALEENGRQATLRFETEIQRLTAQHAAAIVAAQQQGETEIQRLTTQHTAEIRRLEDRNLQEIQRNVDAMRIRDETIKAKDASIQAAIGAQHTAEMAKQAAQQKLAADIQLLTTQHAAAITAAQQQRTAEVQRLTTQHAAAITAAQQQRATLTTQHAAAIAAMQQAAAAAPSKAEAKLAHIRGMAQDAINQGYKGMLKHWVIDYLNANP
jgi:energy-coupling factor transporter ATP-binding protein EcfA2